MQPTANVWSIRLLAARRSLNLTRAQLASRAGVSSQTVKAYELGLRQPSRGLLAALMDGLKMDRAGRDEIFQSAGFATISTQAGPAASPGYRFTEAEARQYVDTITWPAFVSDDLMRVVVANLPAQALWGVNIARDAPNLERRNLLRFTSTPRVAARMVNWDEMVSQGIALLKSQHLGAESIEAPSSFFAQVIEDLTQGDPQYVARFFELFNQVKPAVAKVRWDFPVIWDEPDIGIMRFQCVITEANEPRGHSFNDWIPLDAETWERLKCVIDRWE